MSVSNRRFIRHLKIFVADMVIIVAAYFFVALVSSRFFTLQPFSRVFKLDLLFLAAAYAVVFFVSGIYRRMWRYAGVRDLTVIILASVLADVLYLTVWTLVSVFSSNAADLRIQSITSAILVATVTPLFLICSRIAYSFLFTHLSGKNNSGNLNLAIVGAGAGALGILKSFGTVYSKTYKDAYLFDDDPLKTGRKIVGRRVVGGIDDIPLKCKELGIDEIIIAIPSATTNQMDRIVDKCIQSGKKFYTLPTIKEVERVDPKDYIKYKRKVSVNDLLSRDEIIIYDDKMYGFIKGKTVMVTGGGGSIGSELCRQVAKLDPAKLVIVDMYENNAYEIQQELLMLYGKKLDLSVEILNVRENSVLNKIFDKYRPNIVYHAAAYKHVPLMESNPEEAVKNNVFGTYNVIKACNEFKTENFILISSDKAVNPTNIMGATKRLCEMLIQSMAGRSSTKYSAVRFGNVLGSNGSVIPLFQKQIENGGPVTVTDKNMIRYFMTIPEAVSLVMEASRMSVGGEVFVLDMGRPIRIDDFARKLIKLSGFEPDKDIKVVYTGLRPGEKLYEELFLSKDNCYATENEKIFIEKLDSIDGSFSDDIIDNLNKKIKAASDGELAVYVKKLVETNSAYSELSATACLEQYVKSQESLPSGAVAFDKRAI